MNYYIYNVKSRYLEEYEDDGIRFVVKCSEKCNDEIFEMLCNQYNLIGYQKIDLTESNNICVFHVDVSDHSLFKSIDNIDMFYDIIIKIKNILYSYYSTFSMSDWFLQDLLNIYYHTLYFDYDTKDDLCYLADYTSLKSEYGKIVEKTEIYETKSGYHMKVHLSKPISLNERLKIYNNSNQDKRRLKALYNNIYNKKDMYINVYIERNMLFYDILFTKKYKRESTDVIYKSEEKFIDVLGDKE